MSLWEERGRAFLVGLMVGFILGGVFGAYVLT